MSRYLLFIFILFSTQTLFSQETKYVNTELLNVRSGPGKNYDVLDSAPKGEKINVLSAKGNWTQIQLDSGIKGFVSSKFLSTDIPSSEKTNSETGTWWKAILGTVGFLLLVKVFSGKKSSSSSSENSSRSLRSTSPKKLSSNDSSKSATSTIPTNKSNSVTEKSSPPRCEKYFCKYCGSHDYSIRSLTVNRCSNSPSGKHQPFEGEESDKYFCKYCGSHDYSIKSLTVNRCSNSPNSKHQPFEGAESKKYYCKYCGSHDYSIKSLTVNRCNNSPNGKHQPAL